MVTLMRYRMSKDKQGLAGKGVSSAYSEVSVGYTKMEIDI
jgi:hypothetical protein